MAAFPDGVCVFREKENLPGVVFDPNNKKTLYANDMIALEEEVRAVETTLLTPAGRRMPIVGTGFPNGVVTAPVGAKYIDTNATNGAVEWIKTSGTGNTGWVVSVGDTGWRDVTSTLTNGWEASGGVYIRRVNNETFMKFEALRGTSAISIGVMNFPPGFEFSGTGSLVFRTFLTTATNPAQVYRLTTYGSAVQLQGGAGLSALLYGGVSFPVQIAWPITLPGTAA